MLNVLCDKSVTVVTFLLCCIFISQTFVDKLRSTLCCLSVVVVAWLCNYIAVADHEMRQKALRVLQLLHQPSSQSAESSLQFYSERFVVCVISGVKVKVKVRTHDIAPLHSESPPQKCSGVVRVLKGFHSFTCTPTRSSAVGMSHTCLCLPSYSWYSFTDPTANGLSFALSLG